MIVIKDKKRCCGCYACANVCPKSCISMKRDEEGFSYPEVDVSRCVNCGVCERVCPVLNPFAPLPDAELDALPAHALRINDDSVFMDSSSGGVFPRLQCMSFQRGVWCSAPPGRRIGPSGTLSPKPKAASQNSEEANIYNRKLATVIKLRKSFCQGEGLCCFPERRARLRG